MRLIDLSYFTIDAPSNGSSGASYLQGIDTTINGAITVKLTVIKSLAIHFEDAEKALSLLRWIQNAPLKGYGAVPIESFAVKHTVTYNRLEVAEQLLKMFDDLWLDAAKEQALQVHDTCQLERALLYEVNALIEAHRNNKYPQFVPVVEVEDDEWDEVEDDECDDQAVWKDPERDTY
jgi:hypothetical protein